MIIGRCKICGREGSIFNMFDPYDPDLQAHEQCLERELEKGDVTLIGLLVDGE